MSINSRFLRIEAKLSGKSLEGYNKLEKAQKEFEKEYGILSDSTPYIKEERNK